MAVQSTYSSTLSAAFPGMIADTGPTTVISRTVEDSDIGFGVPVAQGSDDHGCTATLTGVTDIVGITVRDQATDPSAANQYSEGDTAALLRNGSIWVTVTDAGGVVPGDPVWVTLSTGAYSNADVGSGNGLKLAGCQWETTGANGALARIRVNLDVPAVAGAA